MQVFQFVNKQLHITEDKLYLYKDYPLDYLEKHTDALIRDFTKRKLFQNLLELYGHKHDLEGYILLDAHSGVKKKRWVYCDKGKLDTVQNYINQMDGNSLAILLKCCNPKNYKIHSEKSIVIHAENNVNLMDLIRGGHLRIYVPGEGYLDNHYRLKKAIHRLKEYS